MDIIVWHILKYSNVNLNAKKFVPFNPNFWYYDCDICDFIWHFFNQKIQRTAKKVIVTDNAISFPKIPLSNTLTTIDFDEIKKLKIIYNPSIKNALKIISNHQKGELLGYCFNDSNTLKEIKEHIESYLNQ